MVLVFCEGLYLNTIKYVIVSYATEGPLLEESLRIIIFSLGIACMIFQACGQSIHEACYRTLWQDLVLKLLWSRKNGFQKRKKKKKEFLSGLITPKGCVQAIFEIWVSRKPRDLIKQMTVFTRQDTVKE
jgi:hypothetical protein